MTKEKELNHLTIAMDGDGHWTQKRHLPRIVRHKQGIQSIRKIALAADEMGVKVLTLYAFSIENWGRPTDEINYLMKLSITSFDKFMSKSMENNVEVSIMGFLNELPDKTLAIAQKAMEDTKDNTGMILSFTFNYGSRREITTVTKKIAKQAKSKSITLGGVNNKLVNQELLTANLPYPDPDLILRTSGEQRISSSLLWQLVYSELAFTDKYWPDFSEEDLKKVITDLRGRGRRFGKL